MRPSWSVILHRPASLKALVAFAAVRSESGEPLHERYALKVNSHIVTSSTQTLEAWRNIKKVYDLKDSIPMADWMKIQEAAVAFRNAVGGIGFGDLGKDRIIIDTGINKDYYAYYQAVFTSLYLQALEGVTPDINGNIIINCTSEVRRELRHRHGVYARNVHVKNPIIEDNAVVANVIAQNIHVASGSLMMDILEESDAVVVCVEGMLTTDLFIKGGRKIRIT